MSTSITLSFVGKLSQESNSYFLFQGVADNELPCWYILEMPTHAGKNLNEYVGSVIEIASFGVIIKSGFGVNPPPHVLINFAG